MKYSQLLLKLGRLGIAQVGRLTAENYNLVILGKADEVIFPFPFTGYRIILDDGVDSEIDDEIIDALLRRFGKTRQDLDPIN